MPVHLRETPADPGPPPGAAKLPGAKGDASPAAEPLILCRACRHPVTREEERIAVGGGHRHTFANPSGIVFEIGCFRSAPGCAAVGPPSGEFTWFPGHVWRVGVCAACRLHLGWRFSSAGGAAFYGLILDRLIAAE